MEDCTKHLSQRERPNTMTAWPKKEQREEMEIRGFINHYARLPQRRKLEVVERREKPDYFLKDVATGQLVGVELTSVYLTDRSVPDEHIPPIPAHFFTVGIPHDENQVTQYRARLIDAITAKVSKAQNGYNLRYPLILSIYVNEYRAIFLDTPFHWKQLVREHESVFDNCHPFSEVVFWSLPNDMVFSVCPDKGV